MYETLSSQNRFALTFRTLAMKTEVGRAKKIAGFVEMLKQGETFHPQGSPKAAPKKSRSSPLRRPRGGLVRFASRAS